MWYGFALKVKMIYHYVEYVQSTENSFCELLTRIVNKEHISRHFHCANDFIKSCLEGVQAILYERLQRIKQFEYRVCAISCIMKSCIFLGNANNFI